jgi:hypothetical protein
MKTYFKPTNSFVYLQGNSCHNKHVCSGFIKVETIRHIRNTNNGDDLHDIISNFRKRLIDRGYRKSEIEKSISTILSEDRSNFLQPTINKKEIPLIMGSKFNRLIRIKNSILKYWNLLKFNETCKKTHKKNQQKPFVAYKKHKNLGEILTCAKIK